MAIRSRVVLLCFVVAVACWAIAFHKEFFSRVRFDDDYLFYLYSADAVGSPRDNAELSDNLLAQFDRYPELEALRFRNEVKRGYYDNYQLLSWTWLGLRHGRNALCPLFADARTCAELDAKIDFGELAWALWSSGMLWGGVILALSYGIAGRSRAVELTGAVLVAYALTYLPEPGGGARLSLATPHFIRDTLAFIIANPVHFGIFSFEARGIFALAMVPLFLLRWNGRYWQSYLWLLLAGLLHRTNGGIVCLMLVAIDLTIRPGLFRDWRATVPVLLVALQSIIFDKLLAMAGFGRLAIGLAGLAVAVLVVRLAWRALAPRIGPLLAKYECNDAFVARSVLDLAPIAAGFLATLIVLHWVWRLEGIDPLSGRYAWLQLHSRTGILMLVPILIALFAWLAAASRRLRMTAAAASMAGFIGLTGFDAVALWRVDGDWQSLLVDHRGRTWNERAQLAEQTVADARAAARAWVEGECLLADESAEMPWYYGITLALRRVEGYFPERGDRLCLTIPPQ